MQVYVREASPVAASPMMEEEEAVHIGNVVAEKETLLLLKLGRKRIGWEKVCSSLLSLFPTASSSILFLRCNGAGSYYFPHTEKKTLNFMNFRT